MKVIEIPADIVVKFKKQNGEDDNQTAKFSTWAENVIDFYSEVKTVKQVRQVQKIVDSLKAATGTMQLEDADYDLLKAAVDAYPSKLPTFVTRQHLVFIDAVEGAAEVKK